MEQANNTFSHGLQMDTHPMVQGTDSLTDCLNGTLITMNGNEVILQNDMGNRRVDNAFLPAGYEPVGMKEYGGIIYVAAYNPITNKSQIGSFPSPQRKQDIKNFKPTEISFDIKSYGENIGNQSFNFLKSDFELYSLTNDTSLRTGDKFVVYAKGLEGKKDEITNYDNVKNEKIKSPKNKKYTLQIGILNSQNEFIDITKTLCRWYKKEENNWKIIENNENYSEEYKFNQGYFIPNSFTPPSTETISDANLIKSRQLLEANTYSYKLVGPMYLKVIYNHISRFNYNIYGIKNGSELTLWVEGYITYNCPDGVANSEPANNNDTYYTLDEGTPNFKGFELYSLTSGINFNEKTIESIEKSVYDENSNTYSVKIVKKYKCDNINNNTKLDYFIGVYYNDSVFLKDLSEKGSLNISLLGSGELSVENWRFFNDLDQKKTILTFSLNAYPKYGESFENIKFIFSNYTTYCNTKNQEESFEVPTFEVLNIQPYNGRQTIEIDWNEKIISSRAVYYLKDLKYTIKSQNTNVSSKTITFNLDDSDSSTIYWILTTNLFNEFYNTINNFCTTTDESFIGKMNVKVKINKSFQVNQDDNEQEEKIGGLELSTTNRKEITYKIKHIHSVSINNNSTLEIDENYPTNFQIKEEEKRKFKLIKKYKFNNEENSVDNLNTYFNEHLLTFSKGSGSDNSQFNSKTVFIEDLTGSGEDNILKGAINNYDIFIGTCDQQFKGTLENVFDKFSNVIDKVSPNADMGFENSKYKNYYAGIAPYASPTTSENHGYLHIIAGYPQYKEPDGGLEINKDYVRYSEYDDRGYPVAVYQDAIFNYFNETSKPSNGTTKSSIYKSFTYFYSPGRTTATRLPGHDPNLQDRLINSCKVWWKCSDGTWALFPQQFVFTYRAPSILTQFKNYLINHLRYDYVYCMYNTYNIEDNTLIKLYKANKNYTYSKPYSHTIHLYLGLESSKNISEIVNSNFEQIGNLDFKPETGTVKIDAEEVTSYNITSNSSLEIEVQAYINAESSKNIGLIKEDNNIIYVIKDTKGRLLDPNYVYNFNEDGTLTRLDDESKLLAVQEQLDFNLLLYNGWRLGSPAIPFEFDDGTRAFLTFGNLKLVDGV